MSKIYKGSIGLVGNTPLVEVVNIEKEENLEATVLVKLEYFNPAGSVKDRIAKAMIEEAEADRQAERGFRHHRADLWKHRYRPGIYRSSKRLSCHPDHAGYHERGAPKHPESLRRRAGAHRGQQGNEGRHRKG